MNEELEKRVAERTKELEDLNNKLTIQIAEKEHAERERQKYEANLQTIFNTTEIGFILLDKLFYVLSNNSPADKLASFIFGEKIQKGENLASMLSNIRRNDILNLIKDSQNGSPIMHDNNVKFPDGTNLWYRIRVNAVKDKYNETIGFCIAILDYTEQKLTEIENEKITNDLVQRNIDLEQFAYIVSHNLRAPIANILGITSILHTEDIALDDRKQFEGHLFTVVTQLDDVVKDLNKILQIKREITTNKECVRFSSIVEEIKLSLDNIIKKEKAKIIFNFSALDEVVSLKSYLYSIFFNLISNSIKFRQNSEPPIIEIKSEKYGNKFRLIFKDNGTGIDLEKKSKHIFKLYKRFHQEIEGKGMGLFMVKTQVEILGGTISVKSQPNIGTEFFIEFEN